MNRTSEAAPAPDYVGRDARLPLGVKLAYGAPNFAGAGMAIPIAIHMTIFYSDVVLVPLGYIALAVALARGFDAITDPLMGWITDRTRTRWGRRRPWMMIGAPLCAVAFVALFSPPPSLTGTAAALWFTATFVLYFLFSTVYSIPHYGLGPELTLDYKERSSLFGWMEGFSVLGTMAAAIAPALLIPMLGGERPAFTAIALFFGALLTLLYVWLCVRIKERPDFYNRKPNPLVPGVRRVMRNRPFRVLLVVYLIGSTTGAIPGLMMPYFTRYVLQPENPQFWLGIFLLTYFGAGFVFLPLWVWAARRFGKKRIWLVTFAQGMTASFGLFFMGEGDLLYTWLLLVWAGSVFGVRLFLGPAIQADVIDYDELYTGKRREAQYGALWAIMTKFTVIPSASIPLAVLAGVGYVPNIEQSDTVRFAISAMFGLAPAATALVAFGFALIFPIDEAVHRGIIAGIDRHGRGESAIDPLTGQTVPPPHGREVPEEMGWYLDHFSRRELRRAARRGTRALRQGPVLGLAVSLLVLALLVPYVWGHLGNLHDRPPLATVLAVVAGGFALTGAAFHGIRLRAARLVRCQAIDTPTLHAHLRDGEAIWSAEPVGPAAPPTDGPTAAPALAGKTQARSASLKAIDSVVDEVGG